MKRRIGILAFLALAAVLYQGYNIVASFGPSKGVFLLASRGIIVDVRDDGRLEVQSVREKSLRGKVTPGFEAGLKKGDRILAFYDTQGRGGAFEGLFSFCRMTKSVGDAPFTLRVLRPGAAPPDQEMTVTVPSPVRQSSSFKGEVIVGMLAAIQILALLTALFIGFSKPEDDNAFSACLLLVCFATVFASPDLSLAPGWRELALVYFISLNSWVLYLFFRFFTLFPFPSAVERKLPWLRVLVFWATLAAWASNLTLTFSAAYSFQITSQLALFRKIYTYAGSSLAVLAFLLGITSLVFNVVQARTRDDRRRLSILLVGATAGLFPPYVYMVMIQVSDKLISVPVVFIALMLFCLFPLSFAYVVLRHRVFGIRLMVRRGLQWAMVSRGFLLIEGVLIFALLFFGMGPAFMAISPQVGGGATALATASLAGIAVFGISRVNRRIMPVIDRRFFREAYDARQILTELSRTVRSMAGDPVGLLEAVSTKFLNSLHPDRVAIFIRGEDLASFPAGEGGFGPWSRGIARQMGGDFLCLVRAGDEAPSPEVPGGEPPPGLVLSQESLAAERLAKAAEGEAQAVEVYTDDPRSWAHALRQAGAGEARRAEGEILDALHARLLVPLVTKNRLLGFVLLGEKRSEEPYSREDKELLLAVSQQVAIALDYAQLIESAAEQAVLKRDLQIATEVQQNLLPAISPPVPGLDYGGLCIPARGVGGDYFDFLQLEGGKVGLALGDISGKGVGAAILMASLQAMLRSQAPLRGDAVDELAAALNRLMAASTDGSKFSTFFYAVYDPATGDLTYVNAGHNPPMVIRAAGGAPERLKGTGLLLGMFPEAAYKAAHLRLEPGDLLTVFSDGVSEAFNEAGDEFGEERLLEALVARGDLDAKGLCAAVVEAVSRFAGAATQSDDITLVVARRTAL